MSAPPRHAAGSARDPVPEPRHGAEASPLERREAPLALRREPPARGARQRGRHQTTVRRYGWRLFALPALGLITAAALVLGGEQASETPASGVRAPEATATAGPLAEDPGVPGPADAVAPPTASSDGQLKIDQPSGNAVSSVEDSAALPPGEDFTAQGDGTFSIVPGTGAVAGTGALRRYTVEYENGIAGIDMGSVAATVEATLSDPRSWTGGGQFSLQRVDSGPVDFRITLTSSITVRGLCGYDQQIETSCYDPVSGRVALNDARWVRGAVAYASDIDTYRHYMINHETGHALGYGHLYACLPDGKAPIMMQQTITVQAQDGQICQPNPWPFPAS
ncbi:MAG: DUF3152 domain-containing protein [Frankiaceae bacterium]|jgi:hypothetical protein|nr:DUF3152 domain-containing protein [Frankiaceae bacterium]